MQVNGTNGGVELNAYIKQVQQQQRKPNDQAAQSSASLNDTADKVNLSDRAKEIQQAARIAKEIPVVREAKVEQIRLEVDKGTYKVISAQVALGLLKESFENNMVLQRVNKQV